MSHHAIRIAKGLVLVAALALTVVAPALAQPTVDELIEKNLEAKGGKEAWENVKSAHIEGTMSFGPTEAPFVYEWKAPDKVRIQFTLQGMTGIQAYDGETGWMVMPFMGKTEPEKMSAEDTAQVQEMADFRGPFVNPKENGYTIEYAGEEDVQGTPAYKLKVINKKGDVSYVYLDKEYYVEIQRVDERTVRGQEVESTASIGDYKEVDGVMLPFSTEITNSMMPDQSQTMTFEKVELNVDIPDSEFEMPAAPPASDESKDEGGDADGGGYR